MRSVFAIFILLSLALPSAAAKKPRKSVGLASYYTCCKLTANGERYNKNGLTAAHRTLPFGTRLRVTHVASGRSVIVRVNDRGPFIRGRILDLSLGAARRIGLTKYGVARISFEIIR